MVATEADIDAIQLKLKIKSRKKSQKEM